MFWYFFLIDVPRNVLLDVGVLWFRWQRAQPGWQRENAMARARLFRESPLVSVIAPGKNEGEHIPKLVASLARQTWRNTELIVVDDGSTDDTPAICRELERRGLVRIFLRNDARGGKASAANLALRYCKGRFVVHLDADSYLADDAIEQVLLPFYRHQGVGAVAGDVRVANADTSFASSLQAIEYMKSISVGRTVHSLLGTLRIVSGAFGAFPREVLNRVGGWDVGPGLDGDLTQKIRKIGLRVIHEPASVCYTNVPERFTNLARQRFRWDRSLVRFRLRRHRDLLRLDANFRWLNFLSSVENLFFSVVLNIKWWLYILSAVVLYPSQVHILFLANYVLYLVANIAQFLFGLALYGRSARRVDWAMALYLPLMPLYVAFYLRAVRTFAYLMEASLRMSYRDPWNPWKVSRQVLAAEGERDGSAHKNRTPRGAVKGK
jgi:cellulose synthase/poly-beta-1,6-N-acetylglucosamine synthase-like glycosyltransferase